MNRLWRIVRGHPGNGWLIAFSLVGAIAGGTGDAGWLVGFLVMFIPLFSFYVIGVVLALNEGEGD